VSGATFDADGNLISNPQTNGWDPEYISETMASAFGQIMKNLRMKYDKDSDQWVWENMASGATGLYTGEWGDEGKILMAHEKELLLNKTDTENILNAVSFVRNLNALTLERIAAMGGLTQHQSLDPMEPQEKTVEQKVEITANFPNVSVKEEIEAAFDDIINLATQYAFKKK
jgi:hypothetical protein